MFLKRVETEAMLDTHGAVRSGSSDAGDAGEDGDLEVLGARSVTRSDRGWPQLVQTDHGVATGMALDRWPLPQPRDAAADPSGQAGAERLCRNRQPNVRR